MTPSLRILFTNNTLARPAGTELSLHDACLEMKARGHICAAYTRQPGEIAQRLRSAGIEVFTALDDAPWRPDVIHGQHEWETTLAAMRWPDVPVVSFCRGPHLWQEAPCRMPNVVRYAAVDEACRARLENKEDIASDRIEIVLNGVDLRRFQQRAPLPARPGSALIFSNYATEENFVPIVRKACEQHGITLSIIGAAAGNAVAHPENEIGRYDLVFAKGKAALEAAAAGCVVIVGDTTGLGPMVTCDNFDSLRRQSFGTTCMKEKWTAENVLHQFIHYNATENARLCEHVRATCGMARTMDQLEGLYLKTSRQHLSVDALRMLETAQRLMERATLPYKLGRKMQEEHCQRRTGRDDGNMTAEMFDQIFSEFQRADEKLCKALAKSDGLREQNARLKTRLERLKGEPAGALRKAIGRLWRGKKPPQTE